MRRFSLPPGRRCNRSFGPICMHARACDCRHPTPVRGWPVTERWHGSAAARPRCCGFLVFSTRMCSCSVVLTLEYGHCCKESRPRGHRLTGNIREHRRCDSCHLLPAWLLWNSKLVRSVEPTRSRRRDLASNKKIRYKSLSISCAAWGSGTASFQTPTEDICYCRYLWHDSKD